MRVTGDATPMRVIFTKTGSNGIGLAIEVVPTRRAPSAALASMSLLPV